MLHTDVTDVLRASHMDQLSKCGSVTLQGQTRSYQAVPFDAAN